MTLHLPLRPGCCVHRLPPSPSSLSLSLSLSLYFSFHNFLCARRISTDRANRRFASFTDRVRPGNTFGNGSFQTLAMETSRRYTSCEHTKLWRLNIIAQSRRCSRYDREHCRKNWKTRWPTAIRRPRLDDNNAPVIPEKSTVGCQYAVDQSP